MHPSVIEADCTDHSRAGAATWAERNKWADPEDLGKVPMSDPLAERLSYEGPISFDSVGSPL